MNPAARFLLAAAAMSEVERFASYVADYSELVFGVVVRSPYESTG